MKKKLDEKKVSKKMLKKYKRKIKVCSTLVAND